MCGGLHIKNEDFLIGVGLLGKTEDFLIGLGLLRKPRISSDKLGIPQTEALFTYGAHT